MHVIYRYMYIYSWILPFPALDVTCKAQIEVCSSVCIGVDRAINDSGFQMLHPYPALQKFLECDESALPSSGANR